MTEKLMRDWQELNLDDDSVAEAFAEWIEQGARTAVHQAQAESLAIQPIPSRPLAPAK